MKRYFSLFVLALACVGSAHGAYAFEWPEIHGFGEAAFGLKVDKDDIKHDRYNLLEQRVQLKSTYFIPGENWLADKGGTVNFKGDFTLDEYFGAETGLELRELNFALTPVDIMDLKVGRQILTWGTGDYLFVNDLFPKDYISFFSGRDDEYLKKPSDAVKVSLYPDWFNLDLIAAFHEPNTQAKGDRLSFFDIFQGGIAGRESDREILAPARQFENIEYFARAYRQVKGVELALYYFTGFDKNATSVKNERDRELFYRRLDVYGASARGQFAGGISNLEYAYYFSRDDAGGTDRLIENSAMKLLAGYEKDLGNDLKAGVQYMYEQRLDYDEYKGNLLPGDFRFARTRHLLTQRVTKQFMKQTLTVSVFNFYSPSDHDGYVRPSAAYDFSDHWKFTLGANVPWGRREFTEFGQMRNNKNIYARVRYSF